MSDGDPVDWARARRVASRVVARSARRSAPSPIPSAASSGASSPSAPDPNDLPVAELIERIRDVSGLESPAGVPTIQLIGRDEWVEVNLASFRRMLAPVLERMSERIGTAPSIVARAGRATTATQMGLLLGWMAGRVLGQYDLLLRGETADEVPATPKTPASSHGSGDGDGDTGDGDGDAGRAADDGVYLVGPNLAAIEARFGFDPTQFRTWVLAHELTHRAQFTGVPWMRDHFRALVDETVSIASAEPSALTDALRSAMRDPATTRQLVREHGLVGAVASPEQRSALRRVAGLMSLLEGHGDVVMTRACAELVPSAPRFERILTQRRQRAGALARVVQRLSGIEAKLDQYAAGERFIEAVEAHGGARLIDVCWSEPDALPSIEEIHDPSRWLQRCAAAPG